MHARYSEPRFFSFDFDKNGKLVGIRFQHLELLPEAGAEGRIIKGERTDQIRRDGGRREGIHGAPQLQPDYRLPLETAGASTSGW